MKGYHAFQIRPPFTTPCARLHVEPEYTNIHDICACLVWLPPLDSFPENIHHSITDEKHQLKLEDIAGLPIGHVPRTLAGYFRSVSEDGCVFAEVTGDSIPSFSPWPEKDEEGGGIVLPCNYIITHLIFSHSLTNYQNFCPKYQKDLQGNLLLSLYRISHILYESIFLVHHTCIMA